MGLTGGGIFPVPEGRPRMSLWDEHRTHGHDPTDESAVAWRVVPLGRGGQAWLQGHLRSLHSPALKVSDSYG